MVTTQAEALGLTDAINCTQCTHTSQELFYLCLPLQTIYFIMISFLSLLVLILAGGWLLTFIMLRRKLKTLRNKFSLRNLTTNQNFLLASSAEKPNTMVLNHHPYERMRSKSLVSDYHLLNRENGKMNGALKTQQSNIDLPPDYEYNRLEMERTLRAQQNQGASATPTDQANEPQRISCDYDHLDDDGSPELTPDQPSRRHNYFELEGPTSPTREDHTLQNYRILERTVTESKISSYSLLSGLGMASSRLDLRSSMENGSPTLEARGERRHDYHSLESPLALSPTTHTVVGHVSDYHVLEGPCLANKCESVTPAQDSSLRPIETPASASQRPHQYHELERPLLPPKAANMCDSVTPAQNSPPRPIETPASASQRPHQYHKLERPLSPPKAANKCESVTPAQNSPLRPIETPASVSQQPHQYHELERFLLPPKAANKCDNVILAEESSPRPIETLASVSQQPHQYHELERPLLPPKEVKENESNIPPSHDSSPRALVVALQDLNQYHESHEPLLPSQPATEYGQSDSLRTTETVSSTVDDVTSEDNGDTLTPDSIKQDDQELDQATALDSLCEESEDTLSRVGKLSHDLKHSRGSTDNISDTQSNNTSIDSDYHMLCEASHMEGALTKVTRLTPPPEVTWPTPPPEVIKSTLPPDEQLNKDSFSVNSNVEKFSALKDNEKLGYIA